MKTIRILVILLALLSRFSDIIAQNIPEKVHFKVNEDRLTGYFYDSGQPNSPTLLFTHGFLQSGDMWGLGASLSKVGINVMTFDFRGCFESEGSYSLLNALQDIDAALQFLRSLEMVQVFAIDTSRIILGGYSFGGSMSLTYAVYHPTIKYVISIGGGDFGRFCNFLREDTNMATMYSAIFETIHYPAGPVNFLHHDPLQELFEHQEYFEVGKNANRLVGKNILLIAGTEDKTIGYYDQMIPLYKELQHHLMKKVYMKSLPCNHSFHTSEKQLLETIKRWINYHNL